MVSLPRASRGALAGWGHCPVETCAIYRPERISELSSIVSSAPEASLISRGRGRSYGDASLNQTGAVILHERLGRLLDFDAETGVLRCEAAASLAEIIDLLLPRGFFLPVTPGTKHISIGGAIAADVHGKNHHRDGSLSSQIVDFRLLTASGNILTCSREQNAEAFWATVGGMGLTGAILDARIQLQRVQTAYLHAHTERAPDLDAALDGMQSSDRDYAYAVAWIDCLARGRSLGRSLLLRANPASVEDLPPATRRAPLSISTPHMPQVPFPLPALCLNPWTMKLFNAGFYHAHRPGTTLVDYQRYFYPLDAIGHWNRIYGRRGVIQYQVVLPPERSREGLLAVLERVSAMRGASFLAVLKSMGSESGGLLAFARPGMTLALDFPNTGAGLSRLLAELDELVVREGGRVYLAKDSCLSAEHMAAMYPELGRFRAVKAKLDPEQRFSSSLARRLRIVEPA